MKLDDFDRHILQVVQADNQMTHSQIGDVVGLSASAVRRRLKELRKSKAIVADVSVIADELRGLTFITQVKLVGASSASDARFRDFVRKEAVVSQCYSVSGDFDYILIVYAKDPQSYEDWGKQKLLKAENVEDYTSTLVWRQIKQTSFKLAPWPPFAMGAAFCALSSNPPNACAATTNVVRL